MIAKFVFYLLPVFLLLAACGGPAQLRYKNIGEKSFQQYFMDQFLAAGYKKAAAKKFSLKMTVGETEFEIGSLKKNEATEYKTLKDAEQYSFSSVLDAEYILTFSDDTTTEVSIRKKTPKDLPIYKEKPEKIKLAGGRKYTEKFIVGEGSLIVEDEDRRSPMRP